MAPTHHISEITTDVTIIGFGPTGATLAALLGDRGLSVVVVDRLDDLYPHPRAAGIDHEGMRILQRAGVADQMSADIAPYRASEYMGEAGQLIQRIDSAPPPYRLGWNPNYVFDQPKLERMLRNKVDSLPNVTILLGTEVQASEQDADGCRVTGVDGHTGQAVEISSRYVVACDGASSRTRAALGVRLEDHGFHQPWLVADLDVSDEALERLPQTQVQYCDPRRPATYIVLIGNLRRWEIQLDDADIAKGTAVSEGLVWSYLSRWISPTEAAIRRAAAYTFHAMTAKKWQQGKVFLAGDAAHMTPPFMTQGMVQGLRDADNLAWKLTAVIRGHSPESLLETYETERRPHVAQTTTKAIDLGRIIGERDPAAARQRDAEMLSAQGGTVVTRFRQDYIPPLTAGLLALGSPGAGELLPQPFLVDPDGRRTRLDDVVDRGFFVLTTEPDFDSGRSPEILSALGAHVYVLLGAEQSLQWLDERTAHISEDSDLLGGWLASKGARYAVVRPDKYVYGTAADRETLDLLLSELARQRRGPRTAAARAQDMKPPRAVLHEMGDR